MSNCTCCGSSDSVCPCGSPVHPAVIINPPAQPAIHYRAGDFTAFREALLQSLPNETELSSTQAGGTAQIWRPTGDSDLALQMMEWWAYLADILTFYNQRIATQAYLRTADLPESVNRIVAILGYRPRPGIGATGTLAALANTPLPFVLPAGFAIQSKPGPGQPPQVFELMADTTVGMTPTGPVSAGLALGAVPMQPAVDPTQPLIASSNDGTFTCTLAGSSSAIKPGNSVLILPLNPTALSPFVVATVTAVTPAKDPSVGAITNIQLGSNINPSNGVSSLVGSGPLTIYTAGQSSQLWQYNVAQGSVVNVYAQTIDLQTVVRTIKPNDPVLLQIGPTYFLETVLNTSEVLWYANPDATADPSQPPGNNAIAIPIIHTRIMVSAIPNALFSLATYSPSTTFIWHSWKPIAGLIAVPPQTIGAAGASASSVATVLQPSAGSVLPPLPGSSTSPVLVVDSVGTGATGQISSGSAVNMDAPVPLLIPPMQAYINLLKVSRGKTVANEVLGSGNATIAGQDFKLQNAPVTYLKDPASVSGINYSSTIKIWVNGVQWKEARSFYGQTASSRIFITQEDVSGNTHVIFGDGIYGARVPTGVNNIVATYRYGSGGAAPAAGSLNVVLKPQPGLRSIVNPVAVGGGSDPDSPTRLKQLAPKSVLTFGRAVSVDDFRVIAASTPGVTRAMAAVGFDPVSQRPQLTVYVGDDQGAVTAAQNAIAAAADPNRLPAVRLASQVAIRVSLSIAVDPTLQADTVQSAVHAALLDADTGLFGVNNVCIGQTFYDSQIYQACLSVPGVLAVHNLVVAPLKAIRFPFFFRELDIERPISLLSGEAKFASSQNRDPVERLRVPIEYRQIQLESPYNPGSDSYYFLATDGTALTINVEVP